MTLKKIHIYIFFAIVLITVALSVLGPLGLYIYNFRGSSLSSNPDDWASFGDYLGGTINTLFSILNFAAVIGLAFVIYYLETEREEKIQSIALRPFIEIYNELRPGKLSIKLKNIGNGPAKINHISIVKGSSTYTELSKLLPPSPSKDMRPSEVIIEPETYLGAGDEIDLLLISGNTARNEDFVSYLDRALEMLSEVEIVVGYSDIFHKKMDDKRCSLKPFRRWNEEKI